MKMILMPRRHNQLKRDGVESSSGRNKKTCVNLPHVAKPKIHKAGRKRTLTKRHFNE